MSRWAMSRKRIKIHRHVNCKYNLHVMKNVWQNLKEITKKKKKKWRENDIWNVYKHVHLGAEWWDNKDDVIVPLASTVTILSHMTSFSFRNKIKLFMLELSVTKKKKKKKKTNSKNVQVTCFEQIYDANVVKWSWVVNYYLLRENRRINKQKTTRMLFVIIIMWAPILMHRTFAYGESTRARSRMHARFTRYFLFFYSSYSV